MNINMLWQARWLNAYRSFSHKSDGLSLIPRTHIKVEGETDSTELSSVLHMPCGVLMCTTTHNNVFDVYVYLHTYMCTICISGTHRSQRRASDSLDLEL